MQQAPSHLRSPIEEFLPKLRLGLDIGEWAGGIAVVRGREVLHAETYTDYHGTTLKDRRQLRRGRRTRRARKMRLARLRSWLLRQKRPDGTPLFQDPYLLMHRKGFQCQPGEYCVGRKQLLPKVGKTKAALGSWIDTVKRGERLDADSFVIALTHLFQKRGFKWQGSDLREMTDNELTDELKRVRLTPTLSMVIREEIERRRRSPEPGCTGEIPDLDKLLKDALDRLRAPRVAEHRSIVEDELRQLVAKFTERHCPGKRESWTKVLSRLLNKPMRHARFENRVMSGCSWCGKNTPRKSRPGVREKAYGAAVSNLRVEELNARRPLTREERRYFDDLWEKRGTAKPPSKKSIENKLKGLRCQVDMASQLWELLASEKPTGRTNLCEQHLELQRQGGFLCSRHRAICRLTDNGEHTALEENVEVGPAPRAARNPCREAHEGRLIRRIEAILFNAEGGLSYGDIPSLITIEFPKPNTAQTYPCPTCSGKLALDLRLRYKVRAIQIVTATTSDDIYCFACPECSASLQVRAKRQITVKGQPMLILVRLKNTDAFLRKAKGGLKEKKKRTYLAETRGMCIYCESQLDLGSMEVDHIFPRDRGPGIDSNFVAACHACNHPDTGKGSLTPWEWKGQRSLSWWADFERRVVNLPLPLRKKQILLSKESAFPENPTALARAGAGPRRFIEELKAMLRKHGIPEERIADNYESGKIVIQSIEGWMTSRLRQSWLHYPDGTPNFPPKNELDLRNHAQDAALIAACPPHIWRERIFAFGEYHDQAIPGLAPDWRAFSETIARRKPLVSVLGNYAVRWQTGFANTKFWRHPGKKDDPEPVQRRMLTDLNIGQAERIKDEKIRDLAVQCLKDLGLNLADKKLRKRQLPPEVIAGLQQKYPGIRRVQCFTTIGGKPFVLRPKDGPPRKTEAKPASEGVIVWLKERKSLEQARARDLVLSLIRPAPVAKFLDSQVEPPVEEDTKLRVEWRRNQFIWLPGPPRKVKKTETAHEQGWYRFKEFSEGKITLLAEHAVPDELAKRIGITASDEDSPPQAQALEREMGKAEILDYLRLMAVGGVPQS